jgi:hypothetical protein
MPGASHAMPQLPAATAYGLSMQDIGLKQVFGLRVNPPHDG